MSIFGRSFSHKSSDRKSVRPTSVVARGNEVTIDVSGQTCPGYLLAINHAVDPLPRGTRIRLLITYPPCGDDVGTWCDAKGIDLTGISREDGMWVIALFK